MTPLQKMQSQVAQLSSRRQKRAKFEAKVHPEKTNQDIDDTVFFHDMNVLPSQDDIGLRAE